MYPIFLDCEASSLSDSSYPIEIAWSDGEGNIESYLINPYLYPRDYCDWDPSAQSVHHLSRNFLYENGKPPEYVAEKINSALKGKIIYTDAPDFDGFWVDRLFNAVRLENSLKFENIEALLRELLPIEYWVINPSNGYRNINEIYELAREKCGLPQHRAENDVAYLIELYKSALQISETYNKPSKKK